MSQEVSSETALENNYASSASADVQVPLIDEIANTVTHGTGFLLSVFAAFSLMSAAGMTGNSSTFAACAIYVGSLAAVYFASTLSHAVQRPALKRRLRCWDQGVIYLLIAGTYTPFAVAWLDGAWLQPFFTAMWGLALVGFVSKIIFAHRVDGICLPLYLLLAWVPAMVFVPTMDRIPFDALAWVVAGGIAYTIGTVFLVLDHHAWYIHSIWHLLVILGSALQFVAVRYYVVG